METPQLTGGPPHLNHAILCFQPSTCPDFWEYSESPAAVPMIIMSIRLLTLSVLFYSSTSDQGRSRKHSSSLHRNVRFVDP